MVGNIGTGDPVTLTELPTPGLQLTDNSCNSGPKVIVPGVDDGFTQYLDPQQSVQAECTFVNVRIPESIPTLSEWWMISATAGLGLIGVFFTVRRRRLQAGA